MKQKLTLLIVDDHPVFRRGLRQIIEEHPMFEIVGEASDGQTGLELASELKPEIVVLDIDMPRLSGLEMARALQKSKPPVKVLFLTMYKEEDMFNAAMDLGVKAYVLKETAVDDILEALQKVARGETFISQSMSEIGERRSVRVQALLLSKPQIEDLTSAHRLNICHKLNLYGSHSLLKFAFDHKSHL
jgi:DNA-binding NarL/FixJ family response regulator